MTVADEDQDLLNLLEDDQPIVSERVPGWRVLVVDDDPEVHRTTRFALAGVLVEGRPLDLLHAHSSGEALALLRSERDLAVVLLDVVMEAPDSGLALVHVIRKNLLLTDLRIVLRTGQPGYAPELAIIRDYDINDYKTKSELTQVRLISALTIAIRAYRQIIELNRSHRGLDEVVRAAAELMGHHGFEQFSRHALRHLVSVLPGIAAAWISQRPLESHETARIVAAIGSAEPLTGQMLDTALGTTLPRRIRLALGSRSAVFDEEDAVLWLGDGNRVETLLHCTLPGGFDAVDRRLIQIYGVSLVAGVQNAVLFERLNRAAYYDALTGLFNRPRFLQEIDALLGRVSLRERKLALIDVARFSELNDALGQRAGDALLVAIAERLRQHFPASVCIARVSGDAFGLCGLASELAPQALRGLFDEPFYVRGHAVTIQARVGLASLFDIEGGTELSAADTLRNAGLALSQAKRDMGFHISEYTGNLVESARNRVLMLGELRSALDNKRGLELHFQPQVDVSRGDVVGAEALLRWRREDGLLVPPDNFIPLAEYAGLIVELGHWALLETCRRIRQWEAAGLPPLVFAVNVSAVQFRDEGFVDAVRSVLAVSGVAPQRLALEITESVAMEDIDKVVGQLRELKSMGLSIALDDFGCGFSSLSSINQLPFDKVKIDRAFVRALNAENAPDSIARTVTRLAAGLGIDVIAEGVESEEQVALLMEMDCPVMQGYFFGQPMAPADFEHWLTGSGLAARLAPGAPQPG